jgi:hypothetical protein
MAHSINASINLPRGEFYRVFDSFEICFRTEVIKFTLSGFGLSSDQVIYDHRESTYTHMLFCQGEYGDLFEVCAGRLGSEELKAFNSPAKVVILNQFGRVNIHLYEPDGEITAYLSTPIHKDANEYGRHAYQLTANDSLYSWMSGTWWDLYENRRFVFLTLTDQNHKVVYTASEDGMYTMSTTHRTTTIHTIAENDWFTYEYTPNSRY